MVSLCRRCTTQVLSNERVPHSSSWTEVLSTTWESFVFRVGRQNGSNPMRLPDRHRRVGILADRSEADSHQLTRAAARSTCSARVWRRRVRPLGPSRNLPDMPTCRRHQRYMHLSPAATEDAIRLLDGPAKAGPHDCHANLAEQIGDILETGSAAAGPSCAGTSVARQPK